MNSCKRTPIKRSVESLINSSEVYSRSSRQGENSHDLDAQDKFGCTSLYRAVEEKKWRKARDLLASGANPNIATHSGSSLLHLPMTPAFLQELLAKGCDPNRVTDSGLTILHTAANQGDIECLKVALKGGVDVNAVTKSKDTALHFAAQKSHLTAVITLLEWGAYVNAKNNTKATPLHQAAVIDGSRILWALCLHGANLEKADASKNTALHRAAKKGKLKQVNLLIKYGANLNALNDDDYSPLEVVIAKDADYKIAKVLINSNLINSETKKNAFHLTALCGRAKVAHFMFGEARAIERRSLLSEGINETNPLHCAAQKGHNQFVTWLLGKYPKKSKQQALLSVDESGHTPLFLAAKNGHQTVVKTLANACNLEKEMSLYVVKPFLKAVQKEHSKVVEFFLKNRRTKPLIARDLMRKESKIKSSLLANLAKSDGSTISPLIASPQTSPYVRSLLPKLWKKAVDDSSPELALNVASHFKSLAESPRVGSLLLLNAIKMRWIRVLKALLNKGADPMVPDASTPSAWQFIVQTKWKEGLSLLLDVVDIHALDEQENSPLDYAFKPTFCLEVAKALILKGARADTLSDKGVRAIEEMVKNKEWDLMKKLIATGADIPASVRDFPETLVSLIREREYELAECMLKGGANPSIAITEDGNRTPLHYAVIRNDDQMIQLLLKYQADQSAQDKFGLTPAQLARFLGKEKALGPLC